MNDEEARKFEALVEETLPVLPIAALRRMKKLVRAVLKARNGELRMAREVLQLDPDGVRLMEKLVHERKKALAEERAT